MDEFFLVRGLTYGLFGFGVFLFGVFQFGVGYADVVDGGELGFEHLADACDVAEGEVAVVELFLLYLAVDDVVHQFAD